MRTSVASLAVITHFEAGRLLYLAHWNDGWNAFNLPGGHKRDNESYRACLVRELAEADELNLPPTPNDPDRCVVPNFDSFDRTRGFVRVDPDPLAVLRYDAFSQSKQERTQYDIALFATQLSRKAIATVRDNPKVRWLTAQEIEAGHTSDSHRRPVSETVRQHIGWLTSHKPVTWELDALKRTREVMARQLARAGDDSCLNRECIKVARNLRQLFPDARSLVIRQRFEGFRPRLRPHKLLVEVTPVGGELYPGILTGREIHFVKVGRPVGKRANDLEEELRGWERCLPGNSDTILSSLHGVRDSTGQLVGLVYRDAVTALGGNTSSLEEAVRDCCRFAVPTVDSIRFCLRQLYHRLNLRLYGQSFDATHDAKLNANGIPTRLRKRVKRGQKRLDEKTDHSEGTERRRLRREALAILTNRDDVAFLDPFDFLQGVFGGQHPAPSMLVGTSHGDLHGRNIQVGRMQDEVGAIAVFDYGDMASTNHIGWDFVKLETELKVRLYPQLFAGQSRKKYLQEVRAFELRLAERTEAHHHNTHGPDPETDPSLERLAQVILEVRQQARRCLGTERHRTDRWLEEYYFLLVCYGCNASYFPTYDHQEWLGVYCSAGTAARRLSLAWRNLIQDIEAARTRASEMFTTHRANKSEVLKRAAEAQSWFASPKLNHHARQEFARAWIEVDVKTGKDFVQAGLELLNDLELQFQHALEITEIRILALLELGETQKAISEIEKVKRRHVELAFEMECRLGSMIRYAAEDLWPESQAKMPTAAKEKYLQALEIYRRAWEDSRHYYPGINYATLLFLLAENEAERQLARKQADDVLTVARRQPSTELWALLTQGDAHVLLGEQQIAFEMYTSVKSRCTPHNARSVTRQLRMVRRVLNKEAQEFWHEQRLQELFVVEAALAPVITTPLTPGQQPEIS